MAGPQELTRPGILLASGRGRRFWPYASIRNKCAFPVANVPLVRRLALQLTRLGCSPIVVVVGWQEASVRAALHPAPDVSLLFARQDIDSEQGTASALLCALNALGRGDWDTALVVHGDTFAAEEDLRAALEALDDGAEAAAAVVTLHEDRPQNWIGASPRFDGSNPVALTSIVGHGGASHRLAGIYAIRRSCLPDLIATPPVMSHVPVGGMPALERDLAETLARMADDGRSVLAAPCSHACIDLDKPWHILQANAAAHAEFVASLLETGSQIQEGARISDAAEIDGPILVEAGAEIGRRVVIRGPASVGAHSRLINGATLAGSVIVGAHTRISDYCLVSGGTTVGDRCVVGHGGEIDGVMLDGAYIYHYSEIAGVVGQSVDIGAATVCGTLRFDDADTIHRIRGRRELVGGDGANATYFGDYCRTGVNVITQPGVKIGTYSCVGPGVVVYGDVAERKLVLLKQEVVERDWGPERYGW